jgi:hypothetical protein
MTRRPTIWWPTPCPNSPHYAVAPSRASGRSLCRPTLYITSQKLRVGQPHLRTSSSILPSRKMVVALGPASWQSLLVASHSCHTGKWCRTATQHTTKLGCQVRLTGVGWGQRQDGSHLRCCCCCCFCCCRRRRRHRRHRHHCCSGNKATFIGNASDADAALALCKSIPNCKEFAWSIFGPNPPPAFLNSTNATYMINNPTDLTTPSIKPQPGATSGKFLTADSSYGAGLGITLTVHADRTMTVAAGVCKQPNGSSVRGEARDTSGSDVQLLEGEDIVSVRILPDRSVVDYFVQGGRWAGTTSWISGYPRTSEASQVSMWSTSATTADIDVHSMGCGWEYPSYTDSPTL